MQGIAVFYKIKLNQIFIILMKATKACMMMQTMLLRKFASRRVGVIGQQLQRSIGTKDKAVCYNSDSGEKHLKYLYEKEYIFDDPRVSEEDKQKQ